VGNCGVTRQSHCPGNKITTTHAGFFSFGQSIKIVLVVPNMLTLKNIACVGLNTKKVVMRHIVFSKAQVNRSLVISRSAATDVVSLVSKQVLTFVFITSALNFLHFHFLLKDLEEENKK
jgi:hypothetical protein